MNMFKWPLTIVVICGGLLFPHKWTLAGGDKDRLPTCTSDTVIDTTIEVIKDTYVRAGLGGTSTEKDFVKIAQNLGPYAENDLKSTERNMAKSMGYGVEHVRICAATIYEGARLVVYVLSDPDDLNKWALVANNFGLGADGFFESAVQNK